jgi:hypothetical protein
VSVLCFKVPRDGDYSNKAHSALVYIAEYLGVNKIAPIYPIIVQPVKRQSIWLKTAIMLENRLSQHAIYAIGKI